MTSNDAGKKQIAAGVALIEWSGLASWDGHRLCLKPADNFAAFKAHHKRVMPSYGRLLCWIAFEVGCEFIVKGVCLLKMVLQPTNKDTLEKLLTSGRLAKALEGTPLRQRAIDGVKELKDSVRNRDLHSYMPNTRDADFPKVKATFVPALNVCLGCVDTLKLSGTICPNPK